MIVLTPRERTVVWVFVAVVVVYALVGPILGIPTNVFIGGFAVVFLAEAIYFRGHLMAVITGRNRR